MTLYGVLDEGIDYTNNAGHGAVWEMVSGYAQGSRWGMKGSEDLGGGLKAVFQLENGFDVSSGRLGQGGRMFGRQAYVGLSDGPFRHGHARSPVRFGGRLSGADHGQRQLGRLPLRASV